MPKLKRSDVLPLGYDSVAEYYFHQRHPDLTLCTNVFYLSDFTDEDGATFKAKPDFYDQQTDTFIEFKDYKLNNERTKSTSSDRQYKITSYKGYLSQLDLLDTGWNHSVFKQSIVQKALAVKGMKMIVVFSDDTKLPPQRKTKMRDLGLNWMYEADYC